MKIACKIVTHYSLCKSIVRSEKLAPKLKELGVETAIIADINSMSGSVDVLKELEKEKIKPIIGVTLDVVDTYSDIKVDTIAGKKITLGKIEDKNIFNGTVTFLAKNKLGWQSLLRLVSYANTAPRYKDRPTISSETLLTLEERNLIVLTGGYNSLLAHVVIDHEARFAQSFDGAKSHTKKDWSTKGVEYIEEFQRIFGKDNVYLEVQKESMPINHFLNQSNRWLSKKTGAPCIPSNPVHYLDEQDWVDHHLMMCVGNKIKKSQLRELRDVESYPFICGPNFFLDTSDNGYTKEEIDNLTTLAESCESYKVFSNPRLPRFNCPNDLSEPDYLRQLCRDGWKRKIEGKISQDKIQVYADRVKEELDTVKQVDELLGEPLLSRYFLISQDYANYAKQNDIMMGPGRGSSGGCILAYLTNITEIDPITNQLFFSRFFNTGRINKDKFALPDIDMDFEINKRERIIQYITEKYGHNNVGQVVTFGRLQGKGALKEILRINEACTMDEMNKITSYIVDESKIADDLQEMKDDGENPSIIMWALQNNKNNLSRWCYIDEKGSLQGEYARLFEQAVRLEGTLKVIGKHAAAVVISASSLSDICPVLHNKNNSELLAGFEYGDLESLGILKCDILGVAALDKKSETLKLIKENNV